MRTLALELAPDMIRVNSVHHITVDTDMIQNSATYELCRAGPAGGRANCRSLRSGLTRRS
jgi:NAD(P)-dependent dehydrogenase (short-subunit alcohol dehydrogenase family)